MRIFLFLWIITLPSYALTNLPEVESLERLADMATLLNLEVAAAGTVDCEPTALFMRSPEVAAVSSRVEHSERSLRVE